MKRKWPLQRFQNELLDIKEMRQNTLEVHTDGFVMFTDYFFDNIFTDWSIHSKITTAMIKFHACRTMSRIHSRFKAKIDITIEKEQELLSKRKHF